MKTKKSESASANKKKAAKYKKAPDAPKRFKSAFIIFSAVKHKEIKKELEEDGQSVRTTDIAKLVSESWKKLGPEEKKEWEIKAEQDKERYEAEKAMYKGPWKVPSHKKKVKDPNAPKRPSSAFLAYSNSRRAALKREHPKSTNADLSRMLSKSWKELAPTERAVYIAEERRLRDQYKADMVEWRKKVAQEKKMEREQQGSEVLQAAGTLHNPSTLQADGLEQGDWLHAMQQQQDNQQQQPQTQGHQQNSDMGSTNMFSNPFLQAAAFGGGAGIGQGMDVRAAALGLNSASTNQYLPGAFGNQGYGMQSASGNQALSLLGQSYGQNAGMSGQLPSGFYGQNFGGGTAIGDNSQAGGAYGGQV